MKVSFDGVQKLIIIEPGETAIDVKTDLYSKWKEWVVLDDNAKYLIAMNAIGGDPLPGGKFLGTTFFLENGWKIRPFEGDHHLTVSGNIYSRDGSSVIVPTLGNYNVLVDLSTSNLVDTVSTGGATLTPEDIAEAVWGRLRLASASSGTFGEAISFIKATGDSTSTTVSEVNSKLTAVTNLVNVLIKHERNRTRVDQTEKTLTVYDNDGTTILQVYDLKDFTGQPSVTQVAERVPR